MKLLTSLLLLCAATAAQADPFAGGNAQAGQKLFNEYNCNRCHMAMVGGDGSRIFTRIVSSCIRASNASICTRRYCSDRTS